MNPSEAAYPGYDFTIGSERYFIGLFSINDSNYPGIVYPSLLLKEGDAWTEIDKRPAMWSDQQEDFTPELMASLIVKDFNLTLADRDGGTPMDWNEQLAAIFRLRLEVAGNQLVIK